MGRGCVGRGCLILLLCLAWPAATRPQEETGRQPEGPGVLRGTVFTADHPESLLRHAPVDLIYRPGGGEFQRITGEADHAGSFSFTGLDTTSSLAYVLRILRGEREFLSEPIVFPPGMDTLVYNVMATEDPSRAGLPTGHPPLSQPPPASAPKQNDFATFLIVAWIALAFAIPFHLTRSKPRSRGASPYPPEARSLMRDIAALDLRHEKGEIGGAEYGKIRSSLRARVIDILQSGPVSVETSPRSARESRR